MELDLTKFKFPEITDVELQFSTLETDPTLLAEAEARGFYGGHTKYNDLFSSLFFVGGKLKYKKDLDESLVDMARYMISFMKTFNCKHEEKEAVCAMLLSELVEVE